MTDIVPLARSQPASNPSLNLFYVPPTDVSILSYRMVPIQPFTTGINPVDFQIDPQEDYIDLSRSYFQIDWTLKKTDAANAVAAENTFLINNIAHSLFKQISVRLNGTLISPQTDTYHYKAYLETLMNFDRDDGDTILKPQGWFNTVNVPDALTANQLNLAHNDFAALTPDNQALVRDLRANNTTVAAGVTRTLCFVPHIEVFHTNKLLIPNVQLGIQLYFNSADLWSRAFEGANAFRLLAEDIKLKMYLCQVRLNPDMYISLMREIDSGKNLVSYPMVRSDIRTYNVTNNTLHYEINNPFQSRLPNRLVVGIVSSAAFNGSAATYPFSFKKYNLKSIKQVVRGETYPYEALEMVHTNDSQDMRGYRQFLQATGALCKSRGNMVRAADWGHGKNCTLFVFENAANGCLDTPVLNPKLTGELRLVLDFGAAQGMNVTVIVYGEFENVMEINSNKTVQYDVYQT